MSTFEADEHLQELTPLPSAEVEGAGGQSEVKRGRLRYMLRGSVLVRATKALTMLKSILAGVVLSLMLTGGAVAGPFEEGVAAYQRGDFAAALRLMRPLAEQGDAAAQFALGLMYATGQGVPQDYAEAAKWYRLAAEQGDAAAQFNLGVAYATGRGVPQDYVQAYMWFDLAASSSEAKNRASAIETRDLIASRMTPAQIAEAQRLAREWKPK